MKRVTKKRGKDVATKEQPQGRLIFAMRADGTWVPGPGIDPIEALTIQAKAIGEAVEGAARQRLAEGVAVARAEIPRLGGKATRKLTAEQVREVAAKRRAGWSVRRLAHHFGVSDSSIKRAKPPAP